MMAEVGTKHCRPGPTAKSRGEYLEHRQWPALHRCRNQAFREPAASNRRDRAIRCNLTNSGVSKIGDKDVVISVDG